MLENYTITHNDYFAYVLLRGITAVIPVDVIGHTIEDFARELEVHPLLGEEIE